MNSYVLEKTEITECNALEDVIDDSAKLAGSETSAKWLWGLFFGLVCLLCICCCYTFNSYFDLSYQFELL